MSTTSVLPSEPLSVAHTTDNQELLHYKMIQETSSNFFPNFNISEILKFIFWHSENEKKLSDCMHSILKFHQK